MFDHDDKGRDQLVLSELHAGCESIVRQQITSSRHQIASFEAGKNSKQQSDQETLQSTTTRFYFTTLCSSSSNPSGSSSSDSRSGAGAAPSSSSSSGTDLDNKDGSDDAHPPAAKRRAQTADSAGDLVLPRRRRRRRHPRRRRRSPLHITLRHTAQPTPVADVGLQVWRGACLLCDWLLAQPDPPPGTLVLELGGGVGLAAIAAAALGTDVAVTDAHDGALRLAAANLAANVDVIRQLRLRRRRQCQRRCQSCAAGTEAAAPADGGQDGGGPAEARCPSLAVAAGTLQNQLGGLVGGDSGTTEAGTAAAVAHPVAGPSQGSMDAIPGSDARIRLSGCTTVAAAAAATPPADARAGRVRVEVCQLDWFDFLAYGSGSVTVDAIVRVLRADAAAVTTDCLVGSTSSGDGVSGGSSGGGGGGATQVAAAGRAEEHGSMGQVAVACGSGGAVRVLDALAATESLCLVAADTVYDTVLTEAFAKCAAALMSYHASARRAHGGGAAAGAPWQGDRGAGGGDGGGVAHGDAHGELGEERSGRGCGGARLIVALEKRINFVLKDMAPGAPAFDDFMSYVISEPCAGSGAVGSKGGGDGVSGGLAKRASSGERCLREGAVSCGAPPPAAIEDDATVVSVMAEGEQRRPLFRGRRLDVAAVPQVLQYERSGQLELWELTLL